MTITAALAQITISRVWAEERPLRLRSDSAADVAGGGGGVRRRSPPPAGRGWPGRRGRSAAGKSSRRRVGELGGERVVGGVVAQVAGSVGAPDRVRLAEQVVGEPHVAIRVGAAELGERGAGAGADLGLGLAEQLREVVVALAPLEQQLQRRPLVGSHRHRAKA